jgi:hypothetical protein
VDRRDAERRAKLDDQSAPLSPRKAVEQPPTSAVDRHEDFSQDSVRPSLIARLPIVRELRLQPLETRGVFDLGFCEQPVEYVCDILRIQ